MRLTLIPMSAFWRFKPFRHIDYFLSLTFLFIALGAIWYLFFEYRIVQDEEKALALFIGVVGSILGLFQFLFLLIKNKKARLFELRHAVYKDLITTVNKVTESINETMGEPEMRNPHGLVTKLLNYTNEFISIVHLNEDFLFPGIKKFKSSKELKAILDDVVVSTDKLRKEIENINQKNNPSISEIATGIKAMNWHNDMREKLEKLHEIKYSFYKDLRRYF